MKKTEDPVLNEIKSRVDGEVLRFMRDNSKVIVAQANATLHLGIPQVPLFDNYMTNLEVRLTEELRQKGYFKGTAESMIADYWNTFYYSSLPNIMEAQN